MKDLIIIGAGDMGRETAWLVEGINEVKPEWNILGFVDDSDAVQGTMVDGLYPVLGKTDALSRYSEGEIYVICSISTPRIRKMIMERVLQQKNLQPATLIHPSVDIGRGTKIGKGCVLAHRCFLAIDVDVKDHVFLNTAVCVGHDTVIEDYCTVMSSTNLSGRVHLGTGTEIGAGTRIIPKINVCPNTVIGAGAVVVRDITESGTYVGVPVKKVH